MNRLRIDPERIAYMEGDGNYSRIYYRNGESELSSRTLNYWHREFPQLVRVHKQYLVNPDHVVQWWFRGNRDALPSEVEISFAGKTHRLVVSRRRAQVIRQQLRERT